MRKHVISSSSSSQMKARINKPNVFSIYAGFVKLCWGSFLPSSGLHCTCQRYQGRPVRSSTQNQSPAIKSVLLRDIEAATLDRLWSDVMGWMPSWFWSHEIFPSSVLSGVFSQKKCSWYALTAPFYILFFVLRSNEETDFKSTTLSELHHYCKCSFKAFWC